MSYIKNICDSVIDLPMFRGDANNAIFARHLVQETLSELFRQEYTQTKWASGELLPINTSVNEGLISGRPARLRSSLTMRRIFQARRSRAI